MEHYEVQQEKQQNLDLQAEVASLCQKVNVLQKLFQEANLN